MYPLYQDLREKLGAPHWIDQHGVPRYKPFHPDLLGIYDRWAVMFEVECQACRKRFRCAGGVSRLHIVRTPLEKVKVITIETIEQALDHLVSWGDAPWHDADGDEAGFSSQCVGTTMTTAIPVIVEVWHYDAIGEWSLVDISDELRAKHTDTWGDA